MFLQQELWILSLTNCGCQLQLNGTLVVNSAADWQLMRALTSMISTQVSNVTAPTTTVLFAMLLGCKYYLVLKTSNVHSMKKIAYIFLEWFWFLLFYVKIQHLQENIRIWCCGINPRRAMESHLPYQYVNTRFPFLFSIISWGGWSFMSM